LRETKPTVPNIEKLGKLLNITEQMSEVNMRSLEILRWKKGAILYEDNEIVNYSLARLLKLKISDEMLETSQIAKLEIIPDKEDLRFRISFKSNA
jgi:hypothetical protein